MTCRRVNSFTACRKAPETQQGPWVGGGTEGGSWCPLVWRVRFGWEPSQCPSLSVSCCCCALIFRLSPHTGPRFPPLVPSLVVICAAWLARLYCSDALLEPLENICVYLCTVVYLWEQPFQSLSNPAILRERTKGSGTGQGLLKALIRNQRAWQAGEWWGESAPG